MPEAQEGEVVIDDLSRIEPSRENALFALTVAADLLISAREKLKSLDFYGAINDANGCMRMAASALLYNDGYVAGSLESTIYYIHKNYEGMFPIEDWKIAEKIGEGPRGGLVDALIKKIKKEKSSGETFGDYESNAKTAVLTADKFVSTVRYIFEAEIETEMEENDGQFARSEDNT